ncbi:calcium/sodium antiporter [Anaerotruncus rubiinfantis]|uniref:calcium/sodium antiporter n=2 Tax=Anaerotruncus rubiinfantis TaxID=1720200 RepID=UPI0011CAB312|nr:calcium/sodium antiporter [Anaerotruncus rubiinfantis]
MELWMPVLLFAVGVAALVWGGDTFVGAASWIAEKTGIPKFVIGATVVSFATTLPELIVSLMATLDGSIDMAVGNAIGSVSANIGLIMGISLLVLPAKLDDVSFWAKGAVMIISTAFLGAFVIDGAIGVLESLVLLTLLFIFLFLNLNSMKMASMFPDPRQPRKRPGAGEIFAHLMKFILGLSGILLGADLLVDNGERLARMMGVPEALVGLTFVAIGTSLPELITTISAIVRRESSLSVGNIVGANIIDITMILASCAFVSEGRLRVSAQTASLDVPVTLVLMVIAVVPAVLHRRFARWQGILLLAVYGGYICHIALTM